MRSSAHAGGGLLKLTLPENQQSLEATIKPTGSWNRFVDVKLGEITLSKTGKDTAKLEALTINKAGFINLRGNFSITLRAVRIASCPA